MNAITQVRSGAARESVEARGLDFKLEVVVIPVSDVARAAEFYTMLGWRRDADVVMGSRRLLQFTPPGSPCSIIFGTSVTPTTSGPAKFLHLVVSDIETARQELISKGVKRVRSFMMLPEATIPSRLKRGRAGPTRTGAAIYRS